MATATLSGHNQELGGYEGGTGIGCPTFPVVGTVAKLTIGGTSSSAAIPLQATVGAQGVYCFENDAVCHVKFGTSGVTAATTDKLMVVGGRYIIINDPTVTHIAVIAAA